MKFIKNSLLPFLNRVCVITVAVTYFFFLFAQSFGEVRGISFKQYMFLFVFSLALAATFFVFRLPLSKPLLVLVHYVTSATSFFLIFSITKNLTFNTTAKLFVAIMLFTIIYAVLGGLYVLIRLTLDLPSKDVKGQNSGKKTSASKPSYEKRF